MNNDLHAESIVAIFFDYEYVFSRLEFFLFFCFFSFNIFIQVNNSNLSVCSPIVLPVKVDIAKHGNFSQIITYIHTNWW